MSDFSKRIVVIGAGSIGRRYVDNLVRLGYKQIYVLRQTRKVITNLNQAVNIVTNWEDIIKLKPFAAFICNPTSMHIDSAIRLAKAGVHILVEKPLSHSLERITELKEILIFQKVYLHVGYMMRHHPAFIDLNSLSQDQAFGKLISIQSKWGEYLPDWHPWEDYRTSYAAKKELGGGVSLTLSHEIDLINWLVRSRVEKWFVLKNYSSNLEVDVESGAEIILKFKNGITANIHLNFYEKCKERFIKLVYENVTVLIDFVENSMTIKNVGKKINYSEYDRNDLFISQINFFMMKIKTFKKKDVLENINESLKIIKICNG
jgi:predicted dehydrogenase